MLLIALLILNATATEFSCLDSGSCLHCERAEMNEEYCLATGKKIKVICFLESNQKLIDYKSCKATPSEDRFHFIVFQFIMGVVGGLAYWGVQTRKQSQLTLFEDRKQRYVFYYYTIPVIVLIIRLLLCSYHLMLVELKGFSRLM